MRGIEVPPQVKVPRGIEVPQADPLPRHRTCIQGAEFRLEHGFRLKADVRLGLHTEYAGLSLCCRWVALCRA